jgi:hypothetical protein
VFRFFDARHIKVTSALWDVGLLTQSRMKFRIQTQDLVRQRHLRMSMHLSLVLSGLLLEAAAKTGASGPDSGWTDDIERELTDVIKIGLKFSNATADDVVGILRSAAHFRQLLAANLLPSSLDADDFTPERKVALGTWLREATELWPVAAELASLFPADTCETLLPPNAPQIQTVSKLIKELREPNRVFSAEAVCAMKPLLRGDELAQRAKLEVPFHPKRHLPTDCYRALIELLACWFMTSSAGSSRTSLPTKSKPTDGSTAI